MIGLQQPQVVWNRSFLSGVLWMLKRGVPLAHVTGVLKRDQVAVDAGSTTLNKRSASHNYLNVLFKSLIRLYLVNTTTGQVGNNNMYVS